VSSSVETGWLPMRWTGGGPRPPEAVNEERRLFFVGMTRASRPLPQPRLPPVSATARPPGRSLPVPLLPQSHGHDRIGAVIPKKRKPKQETYFSERCNYAGLQKRVSCLGLRFLGMTAPMRW